MATSAGDEAEALTRSRAVPGQRIVVASWATTVVFATTAIADRAGVEALEPVATAAALAFFFAGVVLWLVGFWRAVGRSREEEITLSGLFFLVGTAPRPVQVQLLGSLVVAVAVAGATATAAPFGVMEPVLPLALTELWGARHGVFPARAAAQSGKRAR